MAVCSLVPPQSESWTCPVGGMMSVRTKIIDRSSLARNVSESELAQRNPEDLNLEAQTHQGNDPMTTRS